MKILLIRNDNIGDLICTTPAIEALRKKYPNAQIDIVVNSLNECVIKQNPFIDNIYSYTKPKHKNKIQDKIIAFFKKSKMIFDIFIQGYDVAVIFRTSYSSSAVIFAIASRAKSRIGIRNKGFLNFINKQVIVNQKLHEIDFCFKCLESLNVVYSGEKTLFIPRKINNDFKDFIFFHISSRIQQNKLSAQKIEKILNYLKAKFEKILITSEEPIFAKSISQNTGIFYLETKNIDELATFLKSAKLLITLDGGVAHLGPALDINTISIFGKTDIKRWKPGGLSCKNSIVLQDSTKIAENIDENMLYKEVLDLAKI